MKERFVQAEKAWPGDIILIAGVPHRRYFLPCDGGCGNLLGFVDFPADAKVIEDKGRKVHLCVDCGPKDEAERVLHAAQAEEIRRQFIEALAKITGFPTAVVGSILAGESGMEFAAQLRRELGKEE